MPATLYDGILGASTIRQCTAAAFTAGNQIIAGRKSGGVDPSEFYLQRGEPSATWTTFDLDTVLTALSVSAGLSITTGSLKLPWQKRVVAGTFAGATSHEVISATNTTSTNVRGLVIPTRFEASQTGNGAQADLAVTFISADGLASPVSILTAQSLASSAFNNQYFLGPAYLTADGGSSVQLPKVTGVTINPGIELEYELSDGAVFPVAVYIKARNPSIDIRFRDQAALATWGPLISNLDAALVTFRKGAKGGSRVADSTAEHIAFSFAEGITDVQNLSGSELETAEPAIRIMGKALTVSQTFALSA